MGQAFDRDGNVLGEAFGDTKREDVSRPADGWPWPWENSHTTDYAYAFDNGAVYASNFAVPF